MTGSGDGADAEAASDDGSAVVALRSGGLTLDLRGQRVFVDGEERRLRPVPARLLETLMLRPLQVQTKFALIDEVWEGRAVSDAVLTTAMRDVRRAIGDSFKDPRYIVTVHGRGYRFAQPVEARTELSGGAALTRPEGPPERGSAPPPPAPVPPAPVPEASARWRVGVGLFFIAFLIVGSIGVLSPRGWLPSGEEGAAPIEAASEAAAAHRRFRVAVLDLAGDDEARSYSREVFYALQFALDEARADVRDRAGEDGPGETGAARTGPFVLLDRLPRTIRVAGSGGREEQRRAEAEARDLLRESDADLVVWGEVSERTGVVTLRFSTLHAAELERFRDPLSLPDGALDDLASLVLGVALQQMVGPIEEGAPLPLVEAVAARVRPLVLAKPAFLSDRQWVRAIADYGAIARFVAWQSGEAKPVTEVVALIDTVLDGAGSGLDRDLVAGLRIGRIDNLSTAYFLGEATFDEVVAGQEATRRIVEGLSDPDATARYHAVLGNAYANYRGADPKEKWEAALRHYSLAIEAVDANEERLVWADLQDSTATVQSMLARFDPDADGLEAGLAHIAAAESVYAEATHEIRWIGLQVAKANILAQLEKRGQTGRLREAVAVQEAALARIARDEVPLYWANTKFNHGVNLKNVGKEGDLAALDDALSALGDAETVFTRDADPVRWALVQYAMGNVHLERGRLTEAEYRTASLQRALSHYAAAIEHLPRSEFERTWAIAHSARADALTLIGWDEASVGPLLTAISRLEEAVEILPPEGPNGVEAQRRLERANAAYAALTG